MPLRARPEVETLPACPHGGPDYAELEGLGFSADDVIDFSVSANPFGPLPGIEEAVRSAVIDRYPDSESAEIRRALARNLRVEPENIVVGSGSMELIRLITSAYLGREYSVLIPHPTFGEYEVACRIAGCRIVNHGTWEDHGFRLDMQEFVSAVRHNRPNAVFLCNPNNPTGQYLGREDVERVLSASDDMLLVLDEAYVSFVEGPWRSLDMVNHRNLVVLRSMTKDYGLAGLRLGYAVAHPDVIRMLRKVCPPWNVNAVAQAAGVFAVGATEYVEESRRKVLEARDFVVRELSKLGFSPLPTEAHFFLVKVGNATRFRDRLFRQGIVVRDCSSFGLREYVRIAPRTMPECERLIRAIANLKK